MVDLEIPVCPFSEWLGVNSSGQVAGTTLSGDGICHAFLWTQSSGLVDLGGLNGLSSWARGMNDLGYVAGVSDQSRAFLWAPEGGMLDLGTLGGRFAMAYSVNNRGQVAGVGYIASGEMHPFLWSHADGMVDLGVLYGADGVGLALNESGQVVGRLFGPDRAFSWTKAGGMVDLGSLDTLSSFAAAVNESGQVIGRTDAWGFVWTPATGMVKLEAAGGHASDATAVNDSGQIAGSFHSHSADWTWHHAALWDVGPATQFGGFLPPIASTEVNPAKAGANVSVKWQLLDEQGGTTCDVSLIRSVQYQWMNCEGLPLNDELIPAATSGQSGLRCEDGVYTYNWKTTKAMAGNCYELQVVTKNGLVQTVQFLLK